MTQAEYEAALAAMKGNPPRHLNVGGRQPSTVEELNGLARIHGLKVAGDPVAAPAKAPVKELAPAPPPPSPAKKDIEPEKAAQKEEPQVEKPVSPLAVIADAEKKAETPEGTAEKVAGDPVAPNGIVIPENLAAVKFGDLEELCKALSIDPIPKSTAARIAAIEAKRP